MNYTDIVCSVWESVVMATPFEGDKMRLMLNEDCSNIHKVALGLYRCLPFPHTDRLLYC